MTKPHNVFAVITAAFSFTSLVSNAAVAGDVNFTGPRGTTVQGDRSAGNGTASRNLNIQGPKGGSATLDGSCVRGTGCSRNWSRTLRNGNTASGSASLYRNPNGAIVGKRSGRGFRGRSW